MLAMYRGAGGAARWTGCGGGAHRQPAAEGLGGGAPRGALLQAREDAARGQPSTDRGRH